MKTALTLLSLLFVTVCYSGIEQQNLTVYFDTDQDVLTKASIKSLDKLIKNLKTEDYLITVQGHTDNQGNNMYNTELSKRRAKRVHQYLVNQNIDLDQLELHYQGETSPIKPNNNEGNRSANRRVEVTLTTYIFTDLADFENALREGKTQSFVIDPNEPALIVGEAGTRILIEKSNFTYADGSPVTESIQLELIEALDFSSFITHNLLTVSETEQLESGGMFRLTATVSSGREVRVDQGNPLTVSVPTADRKKDMQVFTSETGSNWTNTNRKIDNKIKPRIPRMPISKFVANPLPEFNIDESTVPKEPKFPRLPSRPHEPRIENYTPNIAWYQRMSTKKIEQRYMDRHERAITSYEVRMDRYVRRMERYDYFKENYDRIKDRHKEEVRAWYSNMDEEAAAFRLSDYYLDAVAENERLYDVYEDWYSNKIEAWIKLKEQKEEEAGIKKSRMGLTDAELMNSYVFAFNRLAWINIDRFTSYHIDDAKVKQITIINADPKKEKVLIVFRDLKSILPLYQNSDKGWQQRIPKGADASVLAYKIIDGQPWISYETILSGLEYTLVFKPCKFRDIRKIFATINA